MLYHNPGADSVEKMKTDRTDVRVVLQIKARVRDEQWQPPITSLNAPSVLELEPGRLSFFKYL